jgi:hypothetical protein
LALSEGQNREFQTFIDGRARLNEQLDRLRADVDRWLESNSGDDPTMGDIAKLAGLLETRKDLLSELAAHDERFLKYLLQIQQRGSRG